MRAMRRAAAAACLAACLALALAACAGSVGDVAADKLIVQADTLSERAARFDFAALALCTVVVEGIDGDVLTADMAQGDCTALLRASARVWEAAEGRWFETAVRGEISTLLLVAKGAAKRRASVLGAIAGGIAGGDLLGLLPVAGRAIGRAATVEAMLEDYRSMSAELNPAQIRDELKARWQATFNRIAAGALAR